MSPTRSPSIKLSVGDATQLAATKASTVAKGFLSEIGGRHPKPNAGHDAETEMRLFEPQALSYPALTRRRRTAQSIDRDSISWPG
jgi:hypothetical protein